MADGVKGWFDRALSLLGGRRGSIEKRAERLEFSDPEAFENWLKKQPRGWSVVLAARAALRTAPLAAVDLEASQKDDESAQRFAGLCSAILRCATIGRGAAQYPTRPIDAADAAAAGDAAYAARAAAAAAADGAYAAARAAAYAADAARAYAAYTARTTAAARAAAYAADAARVYAAARAVWKSLTADAQFLADGEAPERLASAPIWSDGAPDWASDNWRQLRRYFDMQPHWAVWTRWYEARLAGEDWDEEREAVFVNVPRAKWDEGPEAANLWIAERLAELDRAEAPQPEPAPEPTPALRYDLFLSYSSKDLSEAQEIVAILRGAGRSVFFAPDSIRPGRSFIDEVKDGLADSGRLVALYSEHYWASGHCKREWDAAYNADPALERGKLLPLMLRETDLAPIVREIHYVSLFDRPRSDWPKIILAAIGDEATLEALSRGTHGVFDPAPAEDGRLKARYIEPSEKGAAPFGASADVLYRDMRNLFVDYAEHVEETGGNFHFPGTVRRTAKNLVASAPEDVAACDPHALNLKLKLALVALDFADQSGDLPLHDLVRFHLSELRALYERLEALYPELSDYRATARKEPIRLPGEADRAAIAALLHGIADDNAVASPRFAAALRGAEAALREAEEIFPETVPARDRAEGLYEPLKSAAAQIIPSWSWLANPADKFAAAGWPKDKAAAKVADYERLAGKLTPASRRFFDWLLRWWVV